MKKSLLLIFSVFLLIVSCKDDDVVPNRTIFTMNLKEPLYYTADVWIVLRDNDTGDIIDSRMMDKTKPNVFESTKKIGSGKMTVTFFKSPQSDGGVATIWVFSGIDIGTEWTYTDAGRGNFDPNTPGYIGQYSLTVKNAPELYSFSVSDKYGATNLNAQAEYNSGTATMRPIFRQGQKQIVAIDPKAGKQKYAVVENITLDGDVTLDYNNFKEFDKYVHLNLDGDGYIGIDVQGYEGTAKYYSGYSLWDGTYGAGIPKSDMNLGVLNNLSVYRYWVQLGRSTYQYLGPAPTKIDIPSSDHLIAETAIDKFKMEGTSKYNYSKVSFTRDRKTGSEPTIVVEYYTPEGDIKLVDPLTDEIINKYSLKIKELSYFYTELTVGTETLSKRLDYLFGGDKYDPTEPYEKTTIVINKK